jgi:carboxymethylenebutenolidase
LAVREKLQTTFVCYLANTSKMKKVLLFTALLVATATYAQKAACCSPTTEFAQLASAEEFRGSHQLPKQATRQKATGAWVEFATPDEKKGRGYLIKSTTPSTQYLFVYHEWWGLNENIVQETERWAAELKGVNVIALDLYDGKIATTREAAGELMQGANEVRIRNIIQGALEYAGPKAKVASLGWCFGGGWSMQSALMSNPQAVGCVIYYGMPEKNPELLNDLNCKVLGIFAEKDKWINRKVVAEYEQAMNDAGKAYETYWYNAEHAFANPSNPVFDEVAAADARAKTLEFLRGVF